MAYDFSAAASSLLGGMARTRRRAPSAGMPQPQAEDEQPIPGALAAMAGAAQDLGLTQPQKKKLPQEPVTQSPSYQQRAGAKAGAGAWRTGLGGRPVQVGDPIMFGTLINRGSPYASGLYYN